MSTYRSEFEALHKLRTRARDAHLARVADALRADTALSEQLTALDVQAQESRQMQLRARGKTIDPRIIMDLERYELVLKTQAASIHQQQQAVREELQKRRQQLAEAEQQVRVIEKLDDRRRERFEQEQARIEQRTMDEIATQQFLRRQSEDTRAAHS
ncbi:flagellar export protein FliJ [Aeoliella mucimassa]|uniref:Flagellar FliJ protein n=1 Tax=Aeoliella mucimassa TaxID=2527972 RepID=A0A518AKR7_9BACT|nr:flagellar export protein FliJ [Aeoliella mucimassa]QDU55317.1 flagellar biosynthesis chaperone [Aeoliella mucimassa]